MKNITSIVRTSDQNKEVTQKSYKIKGYDWDIRETLQTCSGGLANAGLMETLATRPEPDKISLRVPLIPRRRRVLAANGDPLAQVDKRRIKP